MIKHKAKVFITLLIFTSISSGVSIAQQEPNNAIALETLPKATKGFPLVIKVTVRGPYEVDDFSIYDSGIPIRVYLTSKSDGKKYIIQSKNTATSIGFIQGVGTVDILEPTIIIPEGQKYTMMFDLWSLSSGNTTKTFLSDVPAGKYSVYIEFYQSQLFHMDQIKSDSINIELIEPTDKEKQFIEKTRELGNISGYVNNKVGVNWSKLIKSITVISDDDISELTQISKDQISFHKLISDVNIVDEKSRKNSLKDVNDASVPEFFEPEKQLLLLELKGSPAAECEEFLKEYPELKWKVERDNSSKKKFLLRYKDTSPLTSRPRTRIPVSNPRGTNRPNEIDVNQIPQTLR